MEFTITVNRRRGSVTQGEVDVLINNVKIMSFGDTIELIKPGDKYYGELIGNWASTVPDISFIRGMLYHPFDDMYHYSDRVKKALDEAQAQETQEAKERETGVEKNQPLGEIIKSCEEMNKKQVNLKTEPELVQMPGTESPDWGKKHWGSER